MNGSQIAFVCCVEAGYLELQTVRMVESLRRWGGRLANAPVFAVSTRLDSSLSRETHQAFNKLQVQHLQFQGKREYPWFPYLNKPYALITAESQTKAEYIGFLDSDLLFLGEPDQLIPQPGEDFLAVVTDSMGGTTGPDHPMEPYWQEIGTILGVDIAEIPLVKTEQEGIPIRAYWNCGVFLYRRSTGFAQKHLEAFIQVLDGHVSSKQCGIFFTEQVEAAILTHKLGLAWRALPYSHNYSMNSKTHAEWYKEDQLKAARILHYHDSMTPTFFPTMLQCLQQTHPAVAEWLTGLGALQKNDVPLTTRVFKKVLQYPRAKKKSAYEQKCRAL